MIFQCMAGKILFLMWGKIVMIFVYGGAILAIFVWGSNFWPFLYGAVCAYFFAVL